MLKSHAKESSKEHRVDPWMISAGNRVAGNRATGIRATGNRATGNRATGNRAGVSTPILWGERLVISIFGFLCHVYAALLQMLCSTSVIWPRADSLLVSYAGVRREFYRSLKRVLTW